jgi:ADP-ribose pyrophosphatase
MQPLQPWKTHSRRTVFHQPKWITVEFHDIELPHGEVIADWAWVVTPDFVNVAVVTDDGQFVCFRQVKYAVKGTSLAPVGGYCDPGEDHAQTAQREVREELGYDARTWAYLGSYGIDGNRGCGVGHLWLATGAHKVTEPNADDLEAQEIVLLSRNEVQTALLHGEFKLISWAACMSMALLHSNNVL